MSCIHGTETESALAGFSTMEALGAGPVMELVVEEALGPLKNLLVKGACHRGDGTRPGAVDKVPLLSLQVRGARRRRHPPG